MTQIATNSGQGELSLANIRHQWDPKLTANVEAIIEKVIKKYESGEFSVVITPTMLCSMGNFEARFCSQAFRRKNRSAWVEERFPNGFTSFVAEINLKLQEKDISVVSAKRDLPYYSKLPKPAVTTIKAIAEMVKNGDVNKETAIASLENDYGIKLTKSQRGYYFATEENQEKSDLEVRKAALSKKINAFKKELSVDLSLVTCQQGVLYESFVGVLLADIYGPQQIAAQIEYPILHRDLSGRVKNRVFVDFQVEIADQIQIVEAKLGNSFENILDSALSQMVAIERGTGERAVVSVVYLKPCPVMKFAIDSNIIVDDYMEAMELTDYVRPNRRIKDCLSYRSITELLPAGESVFRDVLSYLQENIATLSREEMRRLTRIFDRVRQHGNIEDSLRQLFLELQIEGVPQSESIDRQFPLDTTLSLAEQESIDRRIGIHLRRQQSALDGVLLDLFNFKTDSNAKQLNESALTSLESLSEEQFQELLFQYYAQKETQQLTSRSRSSKATSQSITGACNRVIAIERADNLSIAQMISRETAEFVAAMSAQRVQISKALESMAAPRAVRSLKEFLVPRFPLGEHLDRRKLASFLIAALNNAAQSLEIQCERFAEEFLEAIGTPSMIELAVTLQGAASKKQRKHISDTERAIRHSHSATSLIHQACNLDRSGEECLPKALRKMLLGLDDALSLYEARTICDFAGFAERRIDDIYHFNPGAIEVLRVPFAVSTSPEQKELFPSPMMRVQILIKLFMLEMENVFMGVELANKTGGIWSEAMISNKPLEAPIRHLVSSLGLLKGFAEIKLAKPRGGVEVEDYQRTADLLMEESAFDFSQSDCADLSTSEAILQRLRDRIAFSHYAVTQYLGYRMLDHYGEKFSTSDGKHRKLENKFEQTRTNRPQALHDVLLKDQHALRRAICVDYFEHKLNQARILSYFDSEIATEFLFRDNPAIGNTEPLPEVFQRLGDALKRSDRFFTEIMS